MTTRARSVIAGSAVAVLIGAAVFWLTVIRDKHKPPVEQPKTMADQLVGKWRLVKRTPPYTGPMQMTFEYTLEGTVLLWKEVPLSEMWIEIGTYRLEGSTLCLTMDTDPYERIMTIDSITEERLVTSGMIERDRIVVEYERVSRK